MCRHETRSPRGENETASRCTRAVNKNSHNQQTRENTGFCVYFDLINYAIRIAFGGRRNENVKKAQAWYEKCGCGCGKWCGWRKKIRFSLTRRVIQQRHINNNNDATGTADEHFPLNPHHTRRHVPWGETGHAHTRNEDEETTITLQRTGPRSARDYQNGGEILWFLRAREKVARVESERQNRRVGGRDTRGATDYERARYKLRPVPGGQPGTTTAVMCRSVRNSHARAHKHIHTHIYRHTKQTHATLGSRS